MKKLKWQWFELKRLYRYWFPEPSKKLLIQTVGGFWLWRHRATLEHKVKLWKSGEGWFAIDVAIPYKKLGVEAKGGFQKYYNGDIARDQALRDHGWEILRVTEKEMKDDPKHTRKRVRRFLKG